MFKDLKQQPTPLLACSPFPIGHYTLRLIPSQPGKVYLRDNRTEEGGTFKIVELDEAINNAIDQFFKENF